ncbi:MAG: protein-disulfide reductase DsbD family protein [Gammaproteobacteria bacterium]|nr:protein-disulfide reductase DsbD family protein [Gammaproteobacteria bacterium]
MLKLGVGLSPIAAVHGETAHLKFTAYPSNTTVTVGTRFSLALDVEPGPNMHVYAPGAEEKGYRVIGFNLDQPEIARIEPVAYPDSEIYYFEPLDERVPVYQRPFTILQEVVMDADAQAEEIMSNLDALTLTGTLDYQACDDAICFLPQSIPVSFTVDLDMPDRQRANR